MKNGSELTELKLIVSTQTEYDSELIELKLIASTQTVNGSELVQSRFNTPI